MPSVSRSPLSAWLMVFCAALFYCYEYFLRIAPSVMVDELRGAFGLDATSFGHLAAFYYYAYTPLQIPVGLFFDRYGARRLLTVACLLCALGSLAFGSTESLMTAKWARFLMGFGSAFAFVGVLSLANDWLSNKVFAMIAGLTTALGMIGAMQGELVLAKITLMMGWQQTMIYAGYLGLLLTGILWLVLRDKPENHGVDIPWQLFFKHLLTVLKNRSILMVGLIGALLYLSLSVFAELWAVPFLETVYRIEKYQAAQAVIMVYLGWALGGPILGFYSDMTDHRILPMCLGAIISSLAIAAVVYLQLSYFLLLLCLFVYGFFCGAEIIIFALAKELAPPKFTATAVAVVNMFVMFMGACLQPLMGSCLDLLWSGDLSDQLRVYGVADYQAAFVVLPIGLILAAIICGLLAKYLFPCPASNRHC